MGFSVLADPRQVYDRIRAAGYSHAQACGILGNIQQESAFRCAVEGYDGTGSYGLCQWLGSRKKALQAFAKAQERPMCDPMTQVEFMLHELQHAERQAGRLLGQCTTAAGAAWCFSRWYERPSKSAAHNEKRASYAERYANQFGP